MRRVAALKQLGGGFDVSETDARSGGVRLEEYPKGS